jgi:glycosyltransferase involved in cell wall biosynthesis
MSDDCLSVIIPVHNGERHLRAALESSLSQGYSPMEIIVVDDGSEDGSAGIARSYEQVRYISQENQGVAAARNRGIKTASGQFLAFLDADDIWVNNKTRRQMDFLGAHPEAAGVCSSFRNFFDPSAPPPPGIREEKFLAEKVERMLHLCTMVIRSEGFDRVGFFNQELQTGEDIDWFARARDAGVTISSLTDILMHRRLHDRNLSYRLEANRANLVRILKDSIERKRRLEGEHSKDA